jgi:hypothetical protein
MNEIDQFEQARALFLSYFLENDDDSRMADAFLAVWNTCSVDAFNRLLVLADAVGDPRFDEYGVADALAILRRLEITDDVNADVETLLQAMKQEDDAARKQAERHAAKEADPYRRAAVRLLTNFRQPNIQQVMHELTKL